MPRLYYNVGGRAMAKTPVPYSLRLPPELRAALDSAAEKDGRTTANLIQKILAEWIAAQKKKR